MKNISEIFKQHKNIFRPKIFTWTPARWLAERAGRGGRPGGGWAWSWCQWGAWLMVSGGGGRGRGGHQGAGSAF